MQIIAERPMEAIAWIDCDCVNMAPDNLNGSGCLYSRTAQT